jgi:hypothetical protein
MRSRSAIGVGEEEEEEDGDEEDGEQTTPRGHMKIMQKIKW